MAHWFKKSFRQLITFPFVFYKAVVSPHLPKACLYEPSCSVYFKESILTHGLMKGFVLGITRILRCNGWFFKGGNDPVPQVFSWKTIALQYRVFRNSKNHPR